MVFFRMQTVLYERLQLLVVLKCYLVRWVSREHILLNIGLGVSAFAACDPWPINKSCDVRVRIGDYLG